MQMKTNPASDKADLRRRAEKRLREQQTTGAGTEADTQRQMREMLLRFLGRRSPDQPNQ